MKTPIGWRTTEMQAEIRQGGSGTIRVRLGVLGDDGEPLDSYEGFTAVLRFVGQGRAGSLSLFPEVVGDADAQTLTIDAQFQTSATRALRPGKYVGDLCVTAPDGERNFPVSMALTVHRSSAPPPEDDA